MEPLLNFNIQLRRVSVQPIEVQYSTTQYVMSLRATEVYPVAQHEFIID